MEFLVQLTHFLPRRINLQNQNIMGRKISQYYSLLTPESDISKIVHTKNPPSCRRLRSFRDCGCAFAANAESGPSDVHPPGPAGHEKETGAHP